MAHWHHNQIKQFITRIKLYHMSQNQTKHFKGSVSLSPLRIPYHPVNAEKMTKWQLISTFYNAANAKPIPVLLLHFSSVQGIYSLPCEVHSICPSFPALAPARLVFVEPKTKKASQESINELSWDKSNSHEFLKKFSAKLCFFCYFTNENFLNITTDNFWMKCIELSIVWPQSQQRKTL